MRTRHFVPVGLCLTGSLILAVPAEAAAQQPTTTVTVSGASPFRDCSPRSLDSALPIGAVEPSLAVNPADPHELVAAWTQDRFRGVVVGISHDGGRRWRQVPLAGLTRCTGGEFDYVDNVSLSFGPSGTAYLSAHVFGDSPASGRAAMRSTDGGRTWSRPALVVSEDQARAGRFSGGATTADRSDPTVAYTVTPKFYQPGLDGVPYRGLVYVSHTRDAGRSWATPVLAYDTGDDALSTGNQLLVLADRTLVDIFTIVTSPGTAQQRMRLAVIRSTDAGRHWSTPTIAADLDSVGTRDPETADPVNSLVNTGSSLLSSAALDQRTGRIYLVWQDARFSAGTHDAIALASSGDGGRTWTAPVRANATPPDIPAGDQQAFAPTIDVADDGSVGASYYDLRNNDTGAPLWTHPWLAVCHPVHRNPCLSTREFGSETRLTSSFDARQATYLSRVGPPGFFLGNYQGLSHVRNTFIAAFCATTAAGPPVILAARAGPRR